MDAIYDILLQYLPYFSIPLISAFIGWITNVIAIKMTFYPLEFFGFGPVGWQGIIPSKAKKMAETAVDLWTSKLIDIREEFLRVSPERLAVEMSPAIDGLSKDIINEVMDAQLPKIWAVTPELIKENIYVNVGKELPGIVEQIMQDVHENFGDLLDLKYLAVSSLTQNKTLLNKVFLKCGKKEFRFIIKSGLYFGFLFGLIQMIVWYIFPQWWILPVFGFLVGYFTNLLALKLIFRPVNPIRIGNRIIQGMFIKRQKEVSYEYSNIVASRIITIESIFEFIIRGPGSKRLFLIVQKRMRDTILQTTGSFKPLLEALAGKKIFDNIRNIASFRFMQELPMNIHHVFGYARNALNLEYILRKRMTNLSPSEFVNFLRPVFKEDEFTLILTGAFLGGIAGLIQYLLIF